MTLSDISTLGPFMPIFDRVVTWNLVSSGILAIKRVPILSRNSSALLIGGARTCAIALLALTLSPLVSFAQSTQNQLTPLQRLYGELQFAYAGVRHSDREFQPTFGSLSVGAWIQPGIGLEVFLDGGLSGGKHGDFDLEVSSTSGIAARFQSPTRNGFFGYLLLGYIETRIDQTEENELAQRTVVQNYKGGRFSVGFGQELEAMSGLVLVGEYRNYFVDRDIEIDAVSVGFRLDFQ